MNAQPKQQTARQQKVTAACDEIISVQAALDEVYGEGYAKNNPIMVAQFMQALATQQLADEMAAFREIIGSGTGAITVGLEGR